MTDIRAVIAATGLYTPPQSVSNEELVSAYNAWADQWNAANAEAIAAGTVEAKTYSSTAFIEKASGIKARHVIDRDGILDVDRMTPRIPSRPLEDISVLAEMAVAASHDALDRAGRKPADVDAVIVGCSNLQRGYPAVAVEVQEALGIEGWGFDMNVACSSATFAIQTAADMIAAGHARSILVCNPEICTAHLNFRDRDSHFIFGDAATAILLERSDLSRAESDTPGGVWEILGMKLRTKYSNNIRNNFGFLNRCEAGAGGIEDVKRENGVDTGLTDKLFMQEGRKVFKEVTPLVADMILGHMQEVGVSQSQLKRMWLHQANLNMNDLIARKVLGREPVDNEAPVILDEYANTSSAGSIIAFHKNSDDFEPGEIGLICSFGAGYSAGSVLVRRAA